MKRLNRFVAVMAGGFLAVLALPTIALAASHYELGGSAELVQPGLNGSVNAVQIVSNDEPGTTPEQGSVGGNIIFDNLNGTSFADLETLSSDYQVTVGDCGGGSPRFYTMLDTDGDSEPDKMVVYYFTANNEPCGQDVENSGNLAESTDNVQIGNLDGSATSTMTLADAKAVYPESIITETSIVGDFINLDPSGQTVIFDNVNIGGTTYRFDAPANKEQCKKDGWREGTYKNQGDCVSSFASKKQQTTSSSPSFLDRIRNLFR